LEETNMSEHATFSAKSGAPASGQLALPKSGKAPGLVLVQEWWGLNDHMKDLANRLAADGFVVLAPDLYHGTITKDASEAGKLMTELDGKRAMDEIAGAASFLAGDPRTNGKVGIIGFCMGGAYSLVAACFVPEISAAVPFYGIPPEENVNYALVKAPVQMHYGNKDEWVTKAKVDAIKAKLGDKMEVFAYDADHAFVNDTRPEVHNPEAAKTAWKRAVDFLHHHLG
jgi:carboxymethylenebutenolidase